jgi:hypothetical protein
MKYEIRMFPNPTYIFFNFKVVVFDVVPHWNSILGAAIIFITIIMMTFITEEDIISILNRIKLLSRNRSSKTDGNQYRIHVSTVNVKGKKRRNGQSQAMTQKVDIINR